MSRRATEPGVIHRLDRWLNVVEAMDLGPLGSFTCEEVTALADLMAYQRGNTEALWVIIHHLVDSDDEEDEELREHLAEWPELAAMLREVVSDDHPIITLLNELENE